MKGKLSEISIVGLIRMFHDGGQSGCLRLTAGDGEAFLYFDAGDISRLDISGPTSADGAYDIFRWRDGEFEFDLSAEIPPGNFQIPVEEFVRTGSDYERRWFAFARNPVENMTFIRSIGRAGAGVGSQAAAAFEILGAGKSLLALSQKLGVGLLQAGEWADELRAAEWVVFETPAALRNAAAVQDLWNAVFRMFRVFAGKVLATKLERRFQEYCTGRHLPVFVSESALKVEPLFDGENPEKRWREANEYLLTEMGEPIGSEAAHLLWEQALSSLEPAARDVVNRYRLTPSGGEKS